MSSTSTAHYKVRKLEILCMESSAILFKPIRTLGFDGSIVQDKKQIHLQLIKVLCMTFYTACNYDNYIQFNFLANWLLKIMCVNLSIVEYK